MSMQGLDVEAGSLDSGPRGSGRIRQSLSQALNKILPRRWKLESGFTRLDQQDDETADNILRRPTGKLSNV